MYVVNRKYIFLNLSSFTTNPLVTFTTPLPILCSSVRFKLGNFNLPVTLLINGRYNLMTNLFVWRLLINVMGGGGVGSTAIHQEYERDSGTDSV